MVYFGKWDDPDGALRKYLEEKDDLHAGRTPRDDRVAMTVRGLTGRFLTTKLRMMEVDELSPRSFDEYTATCRLIERAFGKSRLVSDLGPDDFEKLGAKMARQWGPTRLGNEINRVRVVSTTAVRTRRACTTGRLSSAKGSDGPARRRSVCIGRSRDRECSGRPSCGSSSRPRASR
jgi:hypothetical protein